jgi:hypothetical protein
MENSAYPYLLRGNSMDIHLIIGGLLTRVSKNYFLNYISISKKGSYQQLVLKIFIHWIMILAKLRLASKATGIKAIIYAVSRQKRFRKALQLVSKLGLFKWIAGYRYVMPPTLITMIGVLK